MANLIPQCIRNTLVSTINPKIKHWQINSIPKLSIIFVDQNTGIQSSDLYDGIHPQASGEEKMAQKWFNAISNYLRQQKLKIMLFTVPATASGPANRFELVCPQYPTKQGTVKS